jgi:hypothetical protein
MTNQPSISHATREGKSNDIIWARLNMIYILSCSWLLISIHVLRHTTDVPHILSLIRALAEYEKALSSCHATEESLASTLCFAPSRGEPPSGPGYAKVLLIRTPNDKGYGKLLIGALAKEVKRIGGKRLEWCCLKWNKPSLDFYKMLGAEQMEDWVTLRADGEALDKLADSADQAAKVQVDGK